MKEGDKPDYRHTQQYMMSLQNQPNGEPATFHYGEHTHVVKMTTDEFYDLIQEVKRDIDSSDRSEL